MCRRLLSLKRVLPSPASGLYRYRVNTMGLPLAAAVSGPGTAETNAMRLPSGDHAIRLPVEGRGLLVPSSGPSQRAPLPSGCATTKPDLPPTVPEYVIRLPSGDHSGSDEASLPCDKHTGLPPARVRTQICEYGRPGVSLFCTV